MSEIRLIILQTGPEEADRANLQIRAKVEALRYEIRANYDRLTVDLQWGLNELLNGLIDEPAGTIGDGPEVDGSVTIPKNALTCFLEGDHLQIVRPDFVNLQESDAMFIEFSDEMCAEFCKLQGDE